MSAPFSYPMESLETRAMLSVSPLAAAASGVTAKIVDGALFIHGDARANHLVLTGVGDGEVMITGDDKTSVNGEPSVVLSGFSGDLRVHLRGGKDSLTIDGLEVGGDLHVGAGDTSDAILIKDTDIAGKLHIATRGGHDEVNLLGVAVDGDASIDGAQGHDLITADESTFGAKLTIDAGKGHDTVFLGTSTVTGAKQIVDGPGDDLIEGQAVTDNTDFNQGLNGWSAGFADYDTEMTDLRLQSGLRDLPAELGAGKKGFFIQGMNRSDDLLMYLTRTISGLKANTTYQIRFDLTIGSNAGSGCFGVGGSPGDSVYLKAGATNRKPATRTDKEGFVEVNFDKGQQSKGGKDASVAGNIANGTEECGEDADFVSIRRKHVHTAKVKTDSRGRLHIVVATDSGYEGLTQLYYQQIKAQLVEVAK
jgi:hypothetical protein